MTGSPALGMGVIGATSWVAGTSVLPAIASSPLVRLAAVASRDGRAAAGVASRFGAPHHFGDYEAVITHPDVEAVYIPLPNGCHREWTVRAAAAGKHVLCEKPLAPIQADGQAMATACETAGVVLMEAYMTPFHPRSEVIANLIAGGGLGRPLCARALFTFPLTDEGNHRWLVEDGGGALLDLGVYCLTPLVDVGAGAPESLAARAVMSPSGVDSTFTGWLDFGHDFSAAFACSFDAPDYQHLEVTGTLATLTVDLPFAGGSAGTRGRLLHRDGRLEELGGPDGDPYLGMVEHFADVVRGRAKPRHPPSRSLRMLGLFDRLRAAAGAGTDHPVGAR